MIKKLRNLSALLTGFALLVPSLAAAHVTVTPARAGVGERQTFSISVPNEKEVEVNGLKLVIPAGLSDATPTVKPGWHIQTDTSGAGEAGTVSAITWSGGSIPAGQRDDFTFRAQVPAKTTELAWKAYQTYADGTTVAWDQPPAAEGHEGAESDTSGPYSVTKITNDLAAAVAPPASKNESNNLPLAIALLALVVSVAAILRPAAKPKK